MTTSTEHAPAPAWAPARGDGARAAPATPPGVATAILVATAPAGDGPAAGQRWQGATVLRRLVDQLSSLGVRTTHVITRPAWAADLERSLDGAQAAVHVHACAAPADDLLALARAARAADGALAVVQGDVVTHRAALAGLLADPRTATAVLTGGGPGPLAFGVRTARGRVVSAASAYHAVHRPTGAFLGVAKVAGADRPALAEVAERLAGLVAGPLPDEWRAELERKARDWRTTAPESAGPVGPRVAVAAQDVVALLVVGLVRTGVPVGAGHLRGLFWARPLSAAELARAEAAIGDEDRALLAAAVKATDGFFTTFFVSSYSRHVARWAARRGLTPNAVTTISLLIGLLAAGLFATGERAGLVAGAVLAYVAFVTDCVDGQLARYTRTFSALGAWLDAVFDRTKEYAIYAGLAVGAANAGDPVWLLAGCALALQTVRHLLDFSFAAAQEQALDESTEAALERASDRTSGSIAVEHAPPGGDDGAAPTAAAPGATAPGARGRRLPGRALGVWRRLDRTAGVVWLKRLAAFPIGERFAVIALTAALATPRTTFVVLLAWGGFAAAYGLAGRVLRALAGMGTTPGACAVVPDPLALYRDDGPLARALGARTARVLAVPPVALVLAGAVPLFAVIAARGAGAADATAVTAVAILVVLAGAAGGRAGTGRFRWVVPPALRAAEYAAVLWLGALAGGAGVPAAFALLGALALRHYDLVYRLRHQGAVPPAWLDRVSGGWDGRLVVAAVLLVAGVLPAGLLVIAAVLGVVVVAESAVATVRREGVQGTGVYEVAEDEGQ